ncbi:MAG: deoxyribose-phosphate aldolase [Bacteroidia bacterium]|nr:deoxyribose-phosphate aldolase [Bacteroidia bacterium]
MKINNYIDYTLLSATATPSDIKKLCTDANTHDFHAVCVNGHYTGLANIALSNSKVKVASVIGFPLGAMSTKSKLYEAQECISDGADEIDMVMNIGVFKSKDYKFVRNEIEMIKKAIGMNTLKVIVETCYLNNEELETACEIVMDSGADFIKTSTGFGTAGATLEDVVIIKEMVGDKLKIKASGGIKNAETAKKYIDLGVSRIGTSTIILNE